MLWSFIAVCLSAWLSVDASYRGPTWQRWVFKPLTLLLLLLLAWQAPMFDAISYLVLAGLCASLLGDALTLLPRQRLMYAIGAFFLSHLLYTIYFASQMTLSFFWPLPLVLLVKPPCSMVFKPLMVQPPGVVTLSMAASGCSPVS